ncbi:MAG: ribonuclease H-like domain-containing protein [Kiloniellales bacterium]|nr:ribonuclease H-like domain-containing protein [Kiloniellales bacterium]
MSFVFHRDDLPEDVELGDTIAVDTETMGLSLARDRLCLVQLSAGDGKSHLVQLRKESYDAPRLKAVLSDPKRLKIFHFARFDLAALQRYLKIDCRPVYCTRTASLLVRTYTDRHGLKDLCRELLGVEISKQQQSSDWGAESLSEEQLRYAAADVLYLHRLKEVLDGMLAREGRRELAQAAFDFLPSRAALDLAGWENVDIFAH